jgi:threonine dehydrogenase-like Zn-dependent dehydrogenase
VSTNESPTTCRAVVFGGDGTYEVREFPVPSPMAGGAVLRVEAVGLCASDVAQLHGHKHVPGEVSPVVPGHEIVGRIHALDAAADFGVEEGTRVGVDLVYRCGTCSVCRSGSPYCGNMRVYGYSFGLDERSGLFGGYGEYMEILPGTQLVPLPDDVPAEELSLFEPLASCLNWSDRVGGIGGGETIVVQGPGHMGLIFTAVARAAGAGTIIVTGTSADDLRLAAAREVGADETINVDEQDVVATVAALTGGRMADVVVDLADKAVVTVQLAVELAAMNGRILLAGLKQMAPVELISDLIVFKGLTLTGGPGSTPRSMRAAGELLRSKQLPTRALLGEVMTLDDLDEAMALVSRTAGRDAVRVSVKHA